MDELAGITSRQHKSAQELVTEGLREAILNGELKSGQPLRQVEIAERFGVSSVPVREALRQLEGEGLVIFYPRRGAVVSEISRKEIIEIGEMREVLELLALEKALPNLTPEDLDEAERTLDLLDGQTDEGLLTDWSGLNWKFHYALYRGSGRAKLLGTIKNLHTNADRYVRIHLPAAVYRGKAQEEHRAILERCKANDDDGALSALKYHLWSVHEILVSFVESERH